MFQLPSLFMLLGLTFCFLPSHRVWAQQFNENDIVYEAGRNKIGLIRYCRTKRLLEPTIADQAITAVETTLRELPSSETFDREQGERAQQAGEDGFWDIGRRRDIASVAELFRTTPADLCQEWAVETLRAQAPKRFREVKTITVVPFVQPFEPLPQAEPAVSPRQGDGLPALAAALAGPPRLAPPPALLPPLPEKAPLLPPEAELASLEPAAPPLVKSPPDHRAGSEPMSREPTPAPSAMPDISEQATASLPEPVEAEPSPPSKPTVTAALPSRVLQDPSHPLWAKRSAAQPGTPKRCLMPGCKWPTPQERSFWRY
ncbi:MULTISPECIES: hypothetical protein [Rhodomicrobium]|uniref:hypothetical protein n=1 Tax=Rhodomicrobium TaxID=1068 RepID=UPI000F73956A|nr:MULTISPECIES: hypothetical protein [Rhodomicrobium]